MIAWQPGASMYVPAPHPNVIGSNDVVVGSVSDGDLEARNGRGRRSNVGVRGGMRPGSHNPVGQRREDPRDLGCRAIHREISYLQFAGVDFLRAVKGEIAAHGVGGEHIFKERELGNGRQGRRTTPGDVGVREKLDDDFFIT